MSNKYNPLSKIKIDLTQCGICETCGRRLTDPLCEHATPEQIEYTRKLDAEIDAEYDRKHEQKTTAAECQRINQWLSDNWEFIPEIPFGEGV